MIPMDCNCIVSNQKEAFRYADPDGWGLGSGSPLENHKAKGFNGLDRLENRKAKDFNGLDRLKIAKLKVLMVWTAWKIAKLKVLMIWTAWKIAKLQSQHSMLDHHGPACEMSFKWCFASGSMVACFQLYTGGFLGILVRTPVK